MSLRFNYMKASPASYEAMSQLEASNHKNSLDKQIYELVKIRASQINGCAFCVDMHTKDMRELGESQQRINLISVWREAHDLFTDKEKAVLELTEAVTLISNHGVPEDLYEKVRQFFTEKEYVELIMAINTINSWNRLAIATGMYPGCF